MSEKDQILIVDDIEVNRIVLSEIFDVDSYEIYEAANGLEAMEIIREKGESLDLVLLDIMMPKMNGYEVLNVMRDMHLTEVVPVIVVTIIDNLDNEVYALELGAADIILKPIEPKIVKKRIQNIRDSFQYRRMMLEHKLENQGKENQGKKYLKEKENSKEEGNQTGQEYQRILHILDTILQHSNMESATHMLRVSRYTKVLLQSYAKENPEQKLTDSQIEKLANATLLHDVGKITISENIINKNKKLTVEEESVLKVHCSVGSKIIETLNASEEKEYLLYAYNICKYHHERYDGSGYPDGLTGSSIPYYASITSIANEYDIMTVNGGMTEDDAVHALNKYVDEWFSKEMLSYLNDCCGQFKGIAQEINGLEESVCKQEVETILKREILGNSRPKVRKEFPEFYSLFRYLEATIIEINPKKLSYDMIYSTLTDFTGLPAQGGIREELKDYFLKHIKGNSNEQVLDWIVNSLLNEDISSIGKTSLIYNDVYEEYQWYQVSMITLHAANRIQRHLLLLQNINNDVSMQNVIEKSKQKVSHITTTINHYKQENRNLKALTQYDQLTGLYNKMYVKKEAQKHMLLNPQNQHGLIILDLDDFKTVNDTKGHLVGDRVLQDVGKIIKKTFRNNDIKGRFGGDEFAIFLTNIENQEILLVKCEQLLTELRNFKADYLGEIVIKASIGCAKYPEDAHNFEDLFKKADVALYEVKKSGKGRGQRYHGVDNILKDGLMENRRDNKNEKPEVDMTADTNQFNKELSNVLYEVDDMDEMIERVMDRIARYYKVDSVAAVHVPDRYIQAKWFLKQSYDIKPPWGEQEAASVYREMQEKQAFIYCAEENRTDNIAQYYKKLNIHLQVIIPLQTNDKNNVVVFTKYAEGSELSKDEMEAYRRGTKILSILLRAKGVI